jgi:putative ABC transport system permease protein
MWTDGVMRFINITAEPRRIVGVVPDVDDERIDPRPAMTVYHPFDQELAGGRLFVHTRSDPYALVPAITRTVRELAADQPVERAATLEDVRAEVLAPDRLNAIVFGGFAAVALAISIVGVAGVLAFSVSGRTREFGIRLAVGSQPHSILAGVLAEGLWMSALGVIAGAVGGYALAPDRCYQRRAPRGWTSSRRCGPSSAIKNWELRIKNSSQRPRDPGFVHEPKSCERVYECLIPNF